MKRLHSKITIGQNVFNFVNEVEITSTWKELTDNCSITLPKKITKGDESVFIGERSIFKRGDVVKVELGYYPELTTYFEGYIDRLSLSTPVVIHCENEMWKLKQYSITKSYKSVNVNTLLTDILKGVDFDKNDSNAEIGSFRMTNVTPVNVLEELKKTYSLESFFKGKTLFCGLTYVPKFTKVFNITFERNVVDHSLEWKNESDIKIKLKAISMMPDNSKIEIEVGDVDGEARTGHYYNLTEKQLRDIATREIPKYKFTGFRGSFVTFGDKKISHGDVIQLRSLKFPEQNGFYFVDSSTTSFGQNGFRQNIELGRKAIVGTDFQQSDVTNYELTAFGAPFLIFE